MMHGQKSSKYININCRNND